VVDTLATRRLPALWLLVTLQDKLPLQMRPDDRQRGQRHSQLRSPAPFPSTPGGFPNTPLSTDDVDRVLPASLSGRTLRPFWSPREGIADNRKRPSHCVAAGGGERARYGVFRQAEFGSAQIEEKVLQDLLDRLIAIRKDILAWKEKSL
jgi:hypothetical protein